MAKRAAEVVLSDELLRRLGVSQRKRFHSDIVGLVAWAHQKITPVEARKSRILRKLDRVVACAGDLEAALNDVTENCNDGQGQIAHSWLDHALRQAAKVPDAMDYVNTRRIEVHSLARAAESARAQAAQSAIKSRGKPEGVPKYPELKHFIELVTGAVERARGSMTFDKSHHGDGDGGSCVALLEELRPALPTNFMPAKATHRPTSYGRYVKRALRDYRSLRDNNLVKKKNKRPVI
jgi:hypothetical protein